MMEFVLGKRVGDREPLRLRANEDVGVYRMSWIVVQASHRHAGAISSQVAEGHARTTCSAEDMGESIGLGQLVGLEEILTLGKSQCFERNKEIRSERTAATLSASLAMTMMGPDGLMVEFEADRPAQATTVDHHWLRDRVASVVLHELSRPGSSNRLRDPQDCRY